MGLRINNARNMAGKKYLVSNEVNGVIESIKFGSSAAGPADWKLKYDQSEGNANTDVADLTPIKTYVDSSVNSSKISVKGESGNAVSVTSSGAERTVKLNLAAGNSGLSQAGGVLKSTLKIESVSPAETGYAASYKLTDGTNQFGATINILKDQFLKEASLVWGKDKSKAPASSSEESETKTGAFKYPYLKMVLYTNANGVSSDDTKSSTVYIPVDELFHDYTAKANAGVIQVSISDANEISASVVAGSITNDMLEGKIDSGKLNAIPGSKITSGTITSVQLAANSVTSSQIKDGAVSDAKLASGISGSKLTAGTVASSALASGVQTTLGKADTAIQPADVAKITYTKSGSSAASNVKDSLDDLYAKVGDTAVAERITSAIGGLDTPAGTAAQSGKYVSHVTQADGVVTNHFATVPVSSANLEGMKIQTLDGAGVATSVVDLTPIKTAVEKTVELVEESYELNQTSAEKAVTVTGISGRVIAVFDGAGVQVYPTISYDKQSSTSSLSNDFGEVKKETWTVLHTKAVSLGTLTA